MRESAGKRLEKLKENYVAKCNSIGQQTKIRVINKTPFSFKLSLKVAGVVYQEATLYASDASNNIELNSRTASSGNQNQKSSFSVTALPCGYVWYTVTAERFGNDIKEEERFLKMSCYKMGVFGGSSISIQETHPGSRKFKFEQEVTPKLTDNLKFQTEYRWADLNNQIEELPDNYQARRYSEY